MINRRMLLSGAALLGTTSFSIVRAIASTPGDMVVMAKAMDDIVSGFDPAEAYEHVNVEVCNNLYQMLVRVGSQDTTTIEGDLAESWEISPDGLTLTFHIRQGVRFESGKPLIAADAAFSLQRTVKLDKGSGYLLTQLGWSAENVDELIKAPDEQTLVLTLPEVWAPGIVLSCLTNICAAVVERETVLANEKDGDLGNGWLSTHSAGSGSYRLVEWLASDRIVLQANPNAATQPVVARVVIRHVADPATQLLLLQKGDVDIAGDLGSDQLRSMMGNADYSPVVADALQLMSVAMNMALPQFQKREVLEAVKRAIDYEGIAANITPNTWAVWQSCLPDGTPGAIAEKPFQRDVERAKALMVEAGYADGFNVTLDHYASWPYADIAQAIQANLADIGIKVNLLAGESKQVLTKLRSRHHEMSLGGATPDFLDPHSFAQWFCANPDNSDDSDTQVLAWRTNFADEEMTNAVDKTAKETDEAARMTAYGQLQHSFFERAPFAILLQQTWVVVQAKGVTGLELDIFSNARYANIAKG